VPSSPAAVAAWNRLPDGDAKRDAHQYAVAGFVELAAKLDSQIAGLSDALLMVRNSADHRQAEIARLTAELQEVKDVAEWQPIETAPRGVTVLLWGPSFKRPHVGDWADYRVYNAPGYTRWAPLQAAPKP
jgi:uncharacterized coiled-coil protein SlyX